ncbi:GGDEF domain-containing protein [Paenibacillus turpanensis]|uniref:GGDEF domain-containing protein n=1 Tax=Paenibacillus turpanensis TaxID=2689078 RepID=UPI00140BF1DB|nr:GGDEF domain-containing protein [Paenibacillus turpanensis]
MLEKDIQLDTRSLTRDLLTACWWIFALYLLGTGCNAIFTSKEKVMFLREFVVLPSLKIAAVIGLMELLLLRNVKHIEYYLIVAMNLIAAVIITALYDLPMGIYVLVFPIMTSMFFYSRKLALFSCSLGLASLLLILTLSKVRMYMGHSDIILIVAILLASALLISSLMNRAFKIADQLIRTVEEKQALQTKAVLMERLNRIDPATELYNHRSFHEHIDSLLQLSQTASLDIHLALLDIDNFKRINDTFGHRTGDIIIAYVASQIRENSDPNDFASRYGGEEFAIVSAEKSGEQFYAMMEKIRKSIGEVRHTQLGGDSITLSIGIEAYRSGMSKEQLFEGADSALYYAKRNGKNRTVRPGEMECGEKPHLA